MTLSGRPESGPGAPQGAFRGSASSPGGGEGLRSAPVASGGIVVPDRLRWNPEALAAFEWLVPLLEVPASASPPLAMTPPHPDAVGSYGHRWEGHPSAIEWIEAAERKALRWWQKLAIVRQLEHDADGRLVWDTVVESGSRRIGKSVRLRGVALWRMEHGRELFGERQEIVHTGSDLAVCRKAQAEAWPWARSQAPRLKVTAGNGKEAIASIMGDAWLVRAQTAVYGLDTTLGLVDEGWEVKPATVSEGLEPSLMERVSPQLHLTSTAHRRATSMMRTNIAAGLAGEPGLLLMLWAAEWGADPGDPATWRAASAYWSPARRKQIAKKYERALAGEVDPEADDLDPMSGFMAQYLNRWSLRATRVVPGSAVIDEGDWSSLGVALPDEPAAAVAVEGWPGELLTVARSWHVGGLVVVDTVDAATVSEAAELAAKWRTRAAVLVGADMADDPAWRKAGVRVEKRSGSVRESVSDLSRLLTDGVLRHTGGDHLSTQVLALRTSSSADGLRIRSSSRADAIKAAVWAAQLARKRPVGKPRVIAV